MDPQTKIDLGAEIRALIKAKNRETLTVAHSARLGWEEHRGRSMSPGEFGRHLGWQSLQIPNHREIPEAELSQELIASLTRLVEARRFHSSVRDLPPKRKGNKPPKPNVPEVSPAEAAPHDEAITATPVAPRPSLLKRLKQALSM